MKRADITDEIICRAYARARREGDPIAIIASETGAPYKMVWRAAERALNHGLIDYGVTLRGGWLTEKGLELIVDDHRKSCDNVSNEKETNANDQAPEDANHLQHHS